MGKVQAITYDDYAAITDGKRYEVIDGELVEMSPAPYTQHQKILWRLSRPFYDIIDRQGGIALAAPVDVILAPTRIFQPDLVYLLAANESRVVQRGIEGAPDLCVEILSESTADKDRGVKFQRYFEHGVREYWIVDPDAAAIEVYAPGAAGFELHGAFSGDARVDSALLPELQLLAGKVFAIK